jgi:outer membrane protein assembly factor BamE
MRHFLISALLLSLAAGCSGGKFGPYRIDVQQGNALDQESVARLKPGLSRSQVRFLLGTPLVVDPFRTDRWDYVYLYHKAGKLTEQKRVTLFFEGETLVRLEGDLPEPAEQPPVSSPGGQPAAPAPVLMPETNIETAVPPAGEGKVPSTPEGVQP